MTVFRLYKGKHKNDLSGKGAEISGGRWNSKGVAMVYTSDSRALCMAEIAVHAPLGIIPNDYWIMEIEIPDNIKIQDVDPSSLSNDWKNFPHPHSTQVIGDKFISEGNFLVLKVPSAVVQDDFNYLVNPGHKSFSKILVKSTELFEFDERLFRK